MKLLRKVFSILVVTCLTLGIVAIKPTSTRAITHFWMELSNPRTGANSEYKFHFSIEKRLAVHQYIKLVFPPGTTYQKTPYIPPPDNPCLACQGIPIIENFPDGSIGLKFNTHIELDPAKEGYRDIIVTLPGGVKLLDKDKKYYSLEFFNPPNPGLYTYKIATQAEPHLVESESFKIQDYPLSSPQVDIEPILTKEKAGYSIDFDLNEFCDMKAQKDTINLQFPKEVIFSKLTQNIHRDWITINESNLLEWPSIKDNMLLIPIPFDLKSGQHVSIKIDSRVGITNPEKAGMYELKLMLSNIMEWTRSFPYFVAIPAGQALLKIEPPTTGNLAEFSILQTLERVELSPLDTIYVQFPDTIELPETINPSSILINNKPAFRVAINGQIVAIILRNHAKGWMPLEIKLTTGAGIKTPTIKASIKLELKILKDGEFLPTNSVELT